MMRVIKSEDSAEGSKASTFHLHTQAALAFYTASGPWTYTNLPHELSDGYIINCGERGKGQRRAG